MMSEKHTYPHLASPLNVGPLTLPNRMIMGSMHTGLEDRRRDADRLARYFAERAEGGAGLIVTGGIAPHWRGWVAPFSATLAHRWQLARHRVWTRAVRESGGHIAMQILHAGRYSYQPFPVAPSGLRSPISPFRPQALNPHQIQRLVQAFARSAALAREAGYHGVEIMGSEGYLINEFIARHTNRRQDEYGGSHANRCRFALDIVRETRRLCGEDFLIIFRLSMLDLVPEGSTWDEILQLAGWLQQAGVNVINTGIGWHEARVPTIATLVPRAAFADLTARLRPHVDVPVVASNRINTPEQAEAVLAAGKADLISMARPWLADARFGRKAMAGKSRDIVPCIACNQACLDHVFVKKRASCLVNPRAGWELDHPEIQAARPGRVAVVGAGPAGISAALTAARMGHEVDLYESGQDIGGQLRLAARVPGKDEFRGLLAHYRHALDTQPRLHLHLNHPVQADALLQGEYDHLVVATGVRPRSLTLPDPAGKLVPYPAVLDGSVQVGRNVLIIGTGGIGFDVAEYLLHAGHQDDEHARLQQFYDTWGIDIQVERPGGLTPPNPPPPPRELTLLQRSRGKPGARLGKTTGWIHRLQLKQAGVRFLTGCQYLEVAEQGLRIRRNGQEQWLPCDHVVVCAGQLEDNSLYHQLAPRHDSVHCIGGAEKAGELDAKRAIRQGWLLARSL